MPGAARTSSLRRRLSLRYLLLLAVTFALLGIGVYQALVWALTRDLDAGLLSQAQNGAQTVVAALDRYETDRAVDPEIPPEEDRVLQEALLTSGRYAQLVDYQGAIVNATPQLGGTPLPVAQGGVRATTPMLGAAPLPTPPDRLLSALAGKPSFDTIETPGPQKVETYSPGEEQLRTIFYPVLARGHAYVLEVATPILGVTEALDKARLILLLVTPVLFLIASIAGIWLIHGVLVRVDEMARTARRIGAQSLDERLPEHGPDEIGQLGETFNEMLDRLGRAFDRMRQFTADASHELKTPLTSIRGDAEVGLMRPRTPLEYQQILERVVEETERMSGIVEALLLLARADAHSVPMRMELLEAGDLIEETAASCQAAARKTDIRLETRAPHGLLIRGDPIFLRQLLDNLVSNGIKYTPPGGRVTISAAQEGGTVQIRVEDTGPGIPAEHRSHIFERFYRVDSSHSSSTGGSGLGLAIAQAIAREHGGVIGVEDGASGGALFTVSLPAAEAQEEDTESTQTFDPVELLL